MMSCTGFLTACSILPTTGLALAITALYKYMETWCVKVEPSMVDCKVPVLGLSLYLVCIYLIHMRTGYTRCLSLKSLLYILYSVLCRVACLVTVCMCVNVEMCPCECRCTLKSGRELGSSGALGADEPHYTSTGKRGKLNCWASSSAPKAGLLFETVSFNPHLNLRVT